MASPRRAARSRARRPVRRRERHRAPGLAFAKSTPSASRRGLAVIRSSSSLASIWSIIRLSASVCGSVVSTRSPAAAARSAYSVSGRASATQAIQAVSPVSSTGSRSRSAATSVIPSLPPGTRSRAISAIAVGLSGKVHNAHSQSTTSAQRSGSGTSSASPRWKSTRSVRPADAAAPVARATLAAERSTPSTRAPYSRAASRALVPLPEATSTTRCPAVSPTRSNSCRVRASPPGW